MDEKSRIHAFYVLNILFVVIIALITVQWHSIPQLPELITFALTVTSLVLAVLAIVYAYVSNSSSQLTTARLAEAATTIVDSARDLRRATDGLSNQVSEIPTLVSSVGKSVDQTNALLKEYSNRQAGEVAPVAKKSEPDDVLTLHFLNNASISGLFVIHVFKRALDAGKPFNLEAISKNANIGSADYLYGFLVASSSASVLEYSGREDAIRPERLSKTLSEGIEKRLEEMIKKKFKDESARRAFLAAMGKALDAIAP